MCQAGLVIDYKPELAADVPASQPQSRRDPGANVPTESCLGPLGSEPLGLAGLVLEHLFT